MKYQIWSNVSRLPHRFISGYQASDPMKKSWEGELKPSGKPVALETTLNFLFTKFNQDDRPNGRIACSLSIGDVIVLDDKAHAVRMIGFEPVPNFQPVIGDYE